jgi:hypothetical protein
VLGELTLDFSGEVTFLDKRTELSDTDFPKLHSQQVPWSQD